MKIVIFCHSLESCWNHGNAHFLRGVARELLRAGHAVAVHEPAEGWSRTNAVADGGPHALAQAADLVPGVAVQRYDAAGPDLDEALDGADLVLAHEWNEPGLIAALGARRAADGRFLLFFHDTHHRAVTAPEEIGRFDLDGYDGVLAFGEVLREVYLKRGWGRRVFTWHEAADTALFRPLVRAHERDLVFIGNYGDGERDAELKSFLMEPVAALGLAARVHGVRWPEAARAALLARGIEYAGWLPNHRAPEAFARARVTVHVPRRPYAEALRGIPTIRMFEALACGIPLISAPWDDAEGLFPDGSYLKVGDRDGMTAALAAVLRDRDRAEDLARTGLAAIRARHTCAHRVAELLSIAASLRGDRMPASPAPAEPSRIAAS
ncbi:glycosyltransferase [Rhodoplanes sp. TEM]|uniref:Glycosyltransferase n=1 Tax=Rhodoplanes tepidamans TaxID=200616 RepID=A0ABT5J788_RHOTP|nr:MULTISPECIES: glycosyltransferase [Rhodoplanes]MDC7785489.1 glycosyltransferase [Rhodoplanes tepidamans]MDC7986166.1 glycosyltransferase [Rhodoplanes sp. TEM]MDQ0353341.1 spore maturation protein CgeB [Rhodoplanes tepidamans]